MEEDTVTTPVTVVTDTDTGVVVVGFPPDTSTGIAVIPNVGVVSADPPENTGV